jgi:hypothetical protein
MPMTVSYPEPSKPVHSQSESAYLALDADCQAQNYSHPPPSKNVEQSEELLRTMTSKRQSYKESLNPEFQTTAEYLGMEDGCFLGKRMPISFEGVSSDLLELSQDAFFPTPAMTDPWGEPTPSLSWDTISRPPILLDADMSFAEPDVATTKAAPENSRLVSETRVPDTQSTINTTLSRSVEETQLDTSASTGGRLSDVLKAVAAAGFDSLDDAVVAYYVESLKDNERLGQGQRLNRIRRLPVLLRELHFGAQGWSQWQRRAFQEQIIKSTEDIVIAELKDHLAARRPNRSGSTCSTEHAEQACNHKASDETDIEAEVSSKQSANPSSKVLGQPNLKYSFRTLGPC